MWILFIKCSFQNIKINVASKTYLLLYFSSFPPWKQNLLHVMFYIQLFLFFFFPPDIDECRYGYCQQLCANTLGSYSCSCNPGFLLNSDRRTCQGLSPHRYTKEEHTEENSKDSIYLLHLSQYFMTSILTFLCKFEKTQVPASLSHSNIIIITFKLTTF